MKYFAKHTLPVLVALAAFDALCLVVAIMGNRAETSLVAGAIMIVTNIVVIAWSY